MRKLLMVAFVASLFLNSLQGQETNSSSVSSVISQALPNEAPEKSVVRFDVQLRPGNAKPGDKVELRIKATVEDDWHIYPLQDREQLPNWMPTEIEFKPVGLKPRQEKFTCSAVPRKIRKGDEIQQQLTGTFSWRKEFQVKRWAKEFHGSGSITFQVCDHEKCLPPKTLKFDLGNAKREWLTKRIAARHDLLGAPIQVSLETCEKKRPKAKFSMGSLLMGSRTEAVSLKGSFKTSEGKFDIYLPKTRTYSLVNDGADDTRFENKATYVTIDQNQDGNLEEAEGFASNLPIRVGNEMYAILSVNKDEKNLTLQQVKTPLFGTVVGKKIPPFKYTDVEGKTISNESILGKVTILDIWAVT